MIRNFIITLLIGAVASWFVVGMFAKRSESTSQEGKSIPERISLLGHTSAPKSDAPHIQFLKQFGDISSMIADIDSASPAQLKRWLMSQIDSPEASSETMQLIVTRLASMDPEAAFVFMKEHEELRPYYAIALAEWSKSDLTSALNACFAVDPGGRIVRDVMQELNHETCESIYQDLLDRGFDEASPYVFATTFFKLGRHDPQKAAERALEFSLRSEGQDRAEIGISGVINGWYRRDPEAAYQWVMDQEDPSSKKVAIGVLASAIAKGDGVAGIDRVWDLLDVSQRRQLMGDIDNFVNEDIDTIIEWANANVESPQEHRALLNRFLDRVRLGMSGAENPEEMVKLLSYWEADTSASMLVSNVKQISVRWAMQDPEAFQKWLETVEDTNIRGAAQAGALSYLLAEDPLKAIDYWEEHRGELAEGFRGYGSQMHSLVDRIFDEIGHRDLQTMLDRVPDEWRQLAIASYITRNIEDAPAETLRFLESQPPGVERDQGFYKSVGYWASENPTQAAQWVSDLEEGEARQIAAENLANTWARTDPAAAIEWVEAQPASLSRDKAAEQIVEMASQYYPAETLSLARDIADERVRERLLQEAVTTLARRDPDIAAQQVQAAKLDASWVELVEQERALQESFQK